MFKKEKLKSIAPYIAVTILTFLILFVIFSYFKIDISLPLNFKGDALVHYNFSKNIEQTGWWINNPFLGAPGQQYLYDFPLTEALNIVLIKILILLGLNWYLSVNVFYILTFPLTAFTALYVMRKFGIKTFAAIPLSIIYAFLPYHFYRGVNHLFLSAYYTVPIAILAAYWFAEQKNIKLIYALTIGILIGSSGAYYTFFSCFFIGVGLLFGLAQNFSKKLLIQGAIILGTIGLVFILSFLPTYLNNNRHGAIYNISTRSPSSTEIYGLKLIQLLLPVEDHNLSVLNKVYKQYAVHGLSSTINENQYSALGIVSAFGFLFLLFWAIFKIKFSKIDAPIHKTLDVLSVLNLAAVLFATIGGFSLIISVYLTPVFRSVNRVSIFIAFISLVALGLLLQNLLKGKKATLILWALLPLALFDQVSIGTLRNFSQKPQEYQELVAFSQKIETETGPDGKIYTLPFGLYPEGSEKRFMEIALLTKNTKWSIGAAAWRAESYWQYRTSQLEPKNFLENIIKEGFNGLLIYVPEFDSQKLTVMEQLLESQGTNTLKDYRFYNLSNYAKKNNLSGDPTELMYYISDKCLNNYNGKILTKFWCVDNVRVEFQNKSSKTLNKKIKAIIEYPQQEKSEILQDITIPPNASHVILNIHPPDKAVFPIPSQEVAWPLHLGYPNIIVHSLEIVE